MNSRKKLLYNCIWPWSVFMDFSLLSLTPGVCVLTGFKRLFKSLTVFLRLFFPPRCPMPAVQGIQSIYKMACYLEEHSVARYNNVCFRSVENGCMPVSLNSPTHIHTPTFSYTHLVSTLYFLPSPPQTCVSSSCTCVYTCRAHTVCVLCKSVC